MKIMQLDRMPRKYQLLWNSDQKAIIIRVHKDCLETYKRFPANSPLVIALAEKHEADGLLDSFSGNLTNESFGFNGSIRRMGKIGDYVEFSVPIPKVEFETADVCQECGGTGKREEFEDACLYCSGAGKKRRFDWRTAYLTTSSLAILLSVLDMCDDTSSDNEQHVIVHMMAEQGQHGSSLDGCFGISLCEFLSRQSSAKSIALSMAREAMMEVDGRMLMRQYHDQFRINADQGFLTMDCPGDACGIHLVNHDRSRGHGCEFSCHNVDSPAQSLALLAGIASLASHADHFMRKEERYAVAS